MSITENRRLVAIVRKLVAWPNRHPSLQPFSDWLMRRLARIAMTRASVKEAHNLQQLHEEWSRSAPALANYKLTRIEGDTAYAEIHSECAARQRQRRRVLSHDGVRPRGDAQGRRRTRDPRIATTPGRTFCSVAIRRKGASMADFTPAHLKASE